MSDHLGSLARSARGEGTDLLPVVLPAFTQPAGPGSTPPEAEHSPGGAPASRRRRRGTGPAPPAAPGAARDRPPPAWPAAPPGPRPAPPGPRPAPPGPRPAPPGVARDHHDAATAAPPGPDPVPAPADLADLDGLDGLTGSGHPSGPAAPPHLASGETTLRPPGAHPPIPPVLRQAAMVPAGPPPPGRPGPGEPARAVPTDAPLGAPGDWPPDSTVATPRGVSGAATGHPGVTAPEAGERPPAAASDPLPQATVVGTRRDRPGTAVPEGWPATEAAPGGTVQVTIGRIEVRAPAPPPAPPQAEATPPPAPPPPAPPPRPPALSLDDYLRGRRGGSGR
jgi:hypothetical protein